jgi:hypothetical protein
VTGFLTQSTIPLDFGTVPSGFSGMLGKIVGRDDPARRRLDFPDMGSRQYTARRAKAPYRDEGNPRRIVYTY